MAEEAQQWPGAPAQTWPGTPVTGGAAPAAAADRAVTLEQPQAAAAPQSPGAGAMLQGLHDTEMAARQGVNPNATSPYFPSEPANKPAKLGDVEEMDWGPAYKNEAGEYLRINPQTDFIARDPESGRLAVYGRTPQTDENRAVSASRLITPGLAVGPPTGIARAVPAAASRAGPLAGTAPPARGMVRVYHGGEPHGGSGPRWFTTDRAYAQGYADRTPGAKVSYLDLPESHPMFFSDYPEQGVRQGFTFAKELPEAVAAKRRLLESPGLPLSSASPPASVAKAPSPYIMGNTPVGADLAATRAAEMARDAAAFQRADVRPPPIAFMQGPMAQVGKQVSEIPFVGSPIKNGLDEALKGLSTATENLASRYGSASTPETAGSAIQQGIERFRDARPADIIERAMEGYSPEQLSSIIAAPARDTSMKTKQAALYQRAWSQLPEEMQRGRAVEGLPRIQGAMPETRAVLDGIQMRNQRMINAQAPGAAQAAAPIASGGLLARMIDAIRNPKWTAALQTQRDIRSEFRRLASGMADTERNTLRVSDIERVQSAATRDMIALLERNAEAYRNMQMHDRANAINRSILEFRRADQFTRLAAERMERIERLFNAPSAEALYRNIMSAALSKGKGDLEKLRILTKTLRPEEVHDVAAAVIRQLGEPIGSARGVVQEIGFSPSSALTRWNNMSPQARALIFGHEHAQALNDWFRVTNRLANVEAMANTSRSGTYITNALVGLGSAAMAFNGHTALLGAALGSGGALSLLLSRPAYVRWVIKYAELRAAALRAPLTTTGPRMVALVNQLGRMAQSDPALLPVVRAVAAENGVSERGDQKKPVEGQPRLH